MSSGGWRVVSWVADVVLVVLAVMLGVFLAEYPGDDPAVEVVVVTDTIYSPPPGVIEGFDLDCRWIESSEK